MAELWEETDSLLSQWDPVLSHRWLDLGERLGKAAWRLGSAIHCMNEWVEPDDGQPDVDEDPGPAPGRRTIAAPGAARTAANQEDKHEREAVKEEAGRQAGETRLGGSKNGRLGPGELDKLVLAYMRRHKQDAPHSPSAVAKGIERSSGAVANCLGPS